MTSSSIYTFAAIAFILAITPGADTMLVLNNTVNRNKQAGILATLGICSGLVIYATLSGFGLSIILLNSPKLFNTIKFLGAVYIIFLGVQNILPFLSKLKLKDYLENQGDNYKRNLRINNSFLQGLFTNLANPKVAIFYLTFLPQFIDPNYSFLMQSLLLASIHILFSFIWLSIVALLMTALLRYISNPRVKAGVSLFNGMILILLGLGLMVEGWL